MYKTIKSQVVRLQAITRGFSSALIILIAISGFSQTTNATEEYRVLADDFLSISVFGEPDLSFERIRVGSNGQISLPLIGEVIVSGLKPSEIEEKLETLFLENDYLLNPQVTVFIREYRPIFIYGEVNKPGAYPFSNNLTVEKAIALAGGLAPRASKDKIKLRRKIAGNSEESYTAKMQKLVHPGDVITVGESFF
ncbi:MAG TPA: polysaccharide export protein [Crenotrichaceae bacterium]|nr:polysaccharide export protein [Crenotrichaceae bacterium]